MCTNCSVVALEVGARVFCDQCGDQRIGGF